MFTLYNDSGIVVDGTPVTAATLTYPTLAGAVTVALVLASVVGGTRLTLPSGTVLTPGLGELWFTTAVDTYKGNVNIGASCTGKPAEHIAGAPYPGFPPAASGVDAVPPVSSTTTLATHVVDMETYPDGSVHGIRSDGTTFLIQAAPVVVPPTPTPASPCPSVRVSTGGFLFHATDLTDPAATLLIEDCDGIALGYGYPTAGPGHTAELWSCAQPSVLLGYAANASSCAPPCPCPQNIKGDRGTDGTNGQSAYQAALANGFVGTQAEWLASLQGVDGQNAYQVAVANGFVGTQAAWLASLEGAPGDPGTFDCAQMTTGAPLCAGNEEVLTVTAGCVVEKRALRQNTHAAVVATPNPLILPATQVNTAFEDTPCTPNVGTHLGAIQGADYSAGISVNYLVNQRRAPQAFQQAISVVAGDVIQVVVQGLKRGWDTNPPLINAPAGVFRDDFKLIASQDHWPYETNSGIGTGGNVRSGIFYAVAATSYTGEIDVTLPWYNYNTFFSDGSTLTLFASGGSIQLSKITGVDADNPIARASAQAVLFTSEGATVTPTFTYPIPLRQSACNPVVVVASARHEALVAYDVAVADQVLFQQQGFNPAVCTGSVLVTFNTAATTVQVHANSNTSGTMSPNRDAIMSVEYRASRANDFNTFFSTAGANITITNPNTCAAGALNQPAIARYAVDSGMLYATLAPNTSYDVIVTVNGTTKAVTMSNAFSVPRLTYAALPSFVGKFAGTLAPGATSLPVDMEIVVHSDMHVPVTGPWTLTPGTILLEIDHAA
jgi:hypothetical protein